MHVFHTKAGGRTDEYKDRHVVSTKSFTLIENCSKECADTPGTKMSTSPF
jgi:hypothetical protein